MYMYVCMYVWMDGWMYGRIHVCMDGYMYACMDGYMCVFMYVCMYVCMYICMYVCMYVCMLPNCSKTAGCRASKLCMPTKHSPGKVLKLYWIARCIGSGGFYNPIQRDHQLSHYQHTSRRKHWHWDGGTEKNSIMLPSQWTKRERHPDSSKKPRRNIISKDAVMLNGWERHPDKFETAYLTES